MTTTPGESRPQSPGEGLSPIKRAFLAIDELTAKLAAAERTRTMPIAIVGMGCRFPGGADDPDRFWALLRDGVNAVSPIPPDRWKVDDYYDPDPQAPGKVYTRSAALLDRVDAFDAGFFGIAPREAASMDPQQRLLLEVAWAALEHAGEPADRLAGSRTGVYVGICTNDYAHLTIKQQDPGRFDLYWGSGIAHSIAAGRLSYILGLQGPSLSIDTACSSSLVAVHLACQSLRSGECRLALVGGVNLILSPENTLTFCKSRMLAADGRNKTFDAGADGFVEGEGCAVVVLKRLDEALVDGNRILAIIRGSAVNQDGASSGLTAPNGLAQEAVVREALASGHVDPTHVDYIEAHGTGTVLGDPIEVQALGAVFGKGRAVDRPLMIGSVKTNIGHLEAAAGLAGLIKVVLALQQREVPPHLHLATPNPYIPWAELPIVVPTTRTPWRAGGRPRVGGVSSFGFSGTNAHVVVEEAPQDAGAPGPRPERSAYVLTVSAKTEAALRQRARDLGRHLAAMPPDAIADLCFTANAGRAHLEHRLALVASSSAQLAENLDKVAAGAPLGEVSAGVTRPAEPARVAFLFSGQGAQYARMAAGLYRAEARFRAAVDRCDAILGAWRGRRLLEVLTDDVGAALDETAWAQPALFAVEYGLAVMWRGWGVEPAFVLGHSLGEFTAACVAGVLSVENALALVAERGRLMQELAARGAMAVLHTTEVEVAAVVAAERAAGGLVSIAAVNGAQNVVISGQPSAVARVTAALAARGVTSQPLKGAQAFHSPLMEPVLAPLEAAAAAVTYDAARTGIISTLTGSAVTGAEIGRAEYWRDQARGTVRFADAMQTLWDRGIRTCLELGPHPVLIGLAQQGPNQGAYIASLRRGRDDWAQVAEALGRLYVAGVPIDWAAVEARPGLRRISLPTYPFDRARHWLRPPTTLQSRRTTIAERDGNGHPLVGHRLRSPALKEIVFEVRLAVQTARYLGDHRVRGEAVYPAAAYLESVTAAAAEAFGKHNHRLEDVVLGERLVLDDDEPRIVQIVLTPAQAGMSDFSLQSRPASDSADPDSWRLHASGSIRLDVSEQSDAPPADITGVQARCATELDSDEHYTRLTGHGLDFGPAFRGVERLWRRSGEALGRLRPLAALGELADGYGCHPAMLDAGLQALAAALPDGVIDPTDTYLPLRIDRYVLHRAGANPFWSHAVIRSRPDGPGQGLVGDVRLFGDDGRVVADVVGVHLKRVPNEAQDGPVSARVRAWLHDVRWPVTPRTAGPGTASAWHAEPRDIEERVKNEWPALRGHHDLARYADLVGELDTLAAAYVVAALNDLGMALRRGQRIDPKALPGRLGVVDPHLRLFGRMLTMLEEDGILTRRDTLWEVSREPTRGDLRARQAALESRFPEYGAELALLGRCGPELAAALRGARSGLELVFPGGTLATAEQLYTESPVAQAYNALLRSAISAMCAQIPTGHRIRVLEVGAGTGGSTSFLLPILPPDRTDYIFTDISPLFLGRAREKFVEYPFVRYRPLDIEQSPGSQGFAGERFDVVVAANVLHATADLRSALGHVRTLLAPGGLLALLEMTTPQRDVDLVFGLLEGWWKFTDRDLRSGHPLLDRSGWTRLLGDVGFRDPIALPDEATAANQAIILSRASSADAPIAAATSSRWLIVGGDDVGRHLAVELERGGGQCGVVDLPGGPELEGRDLETVQRRLAEAVGGDETEWRGVVFVAGGGTVPVPDEPMARQASTCGVLLQLVQALIARRQATRLWVVTRGAQCIGGEDARRLDPAQAPLWGMSRVIALEHPELSCVCIDLDPTPAPPARDVAALITELQQPDREDRVAFRGGSRHAARLAPGGSRPEVTPTAASRPSDAAQPPVRLEITRRGTLDSLELQPTQRVAPGPGQIEIEVQATGLNFRDVLGAMGMYPGDPGPPGGECAGTVVAVGPDVQTPRVGDEVVALAAGCFKSYAVTRAEWAFPKPSRWTPSQGATVLVPFLTAVFALEHCGRIRPGERVLVHAAAGGVGLAALQVAKRAGAEVFATAGSPEKQAYLRSLGIRHVMSSRSTDFAAEVRAATGGVGVDLVLNSLAGDQAAASRSVLAPGGRFLEIGKTALLDPAEPLALPAGASYIVIDWSQTASEDPDLITGMLRRLMTDLLAGELQPLPVRSFPLASVVDAFRYMAQARHIGKIAVVHGSVDGAVAVGDGTRYRADATYLVTGGLRGLGPVVARHLVDGGARSLVLMGRAAPTDHARAVVDELRAAGAQVVVVRGDVTRADDVARAFAALADLPPLRGIFHCAGVLDDGVLRRLDWRRFAQVLAPKVAGTWLLAQSARAEVLDFFVLFSSAAAVLGSGGQANHAAANAYLDTFAHALRAEGVSAVSINWGVWSEVGAAAERNVGDRVGAQGVGVITPAEGVLVVDEILRRDQPQVAVLPVHWPTYLRQYSGGATLPYFSLLAGEGRRESTPSSGMPAAADLARELAEAPPAQRRARLMAHVRRQAARVLGFEAGDAIDARQPLAELGLDSLMAVEFRNLLGASVTLERALPATLLFDHPTLEALVDYLAARIPGVEPQTKATPVAVGVERPGDALDRIEQLSDQDVQRLLKQRLGS